MRFGKVGCYNERIDRGSFVFARIMSSSKHPHHPQPRVTTFSFRTNVDQNIDYFGAWLVPSAVHSSRDFCLPSDVEG